MNFTIRFAFLIGMTPLMLYAMPVAPLAFEISQTAPSDSASTASERHIAETKNPDYYYSGGIPFRKVGDTWIRSDCDAADTCQGHDDQGGASYPSVCWLTRNDNDRADEKADAWLKRTHAGHAPKLMPNCNAELPRPVLSRDAFIQKFPTLLPGWHVKSSMSPAELRAYAGSRWDLCHRVSDEGELENCVSLHLQGPKISYQ